MMSLDDQISDFLRGEGWRLSATAAYRDVIGPSGLYTIRVSTNGSWTIRRGRTVLDSAPPLDGWHLAGRMYSACNRSHRRALDISAEADRAVSSMMRANDRPAGNEMSAP